MAWSGWPLERMLILFTSLGFFLIFVQVTLLHARQNFRVWSQWVPVIALPVLSLTALLLSFWDAQWLRTLFVILCLGDLLGGLFGFYQHFTGVGKRVDGYRLHNFLVGPPVVLPLLISALSFLGLMAIYGS